MPEQMRPSKRFADRFNPITRYIERSKIGSLSRGESVRIPLAPFRFRWTRYELQYDNQAPDRTQQEYRSMIFGDQIFPDPPIWDPNPSVSPETERIAGGEENAFTAGKVVVDLGSGQAIALHEYARSYPDTTFIGIDHGYNKSRKLDLSRSGVQLTKDDWTTLNSLRDNSVDTVLSVRGVIPHGINRNNPHAEKIIDTINRVTKEGAIWRFEIQSDHSYRDFVTHLLDRKGWDINFVQDANKQLKSTLVAVKRPA